MATLKLVFDRILFYKMIGLHPEHVRLRQRVEQRLAALKQSGQLYESAERFSATPAVDPASASKATVTTIGTAAEYKLVNHWRAGN